MSTSPSPFLVNQTRAERRALALLARPDVQAALDADAEVWKHGTPGRPPQSYELIRASTQEVALLVALQVVNGDARRPGVVEISAGPHHWGGLEVPGGRWGINNPDTLYFAVPVEPGSSYVIEGRRHADGPIDSNFSVQVRDVWATLDNLGQRDLAIDAEGRYRITVDAQPAANRRNHLQIQPGGTVIIIRQTLADWARARPDELHVERTGGPPADAERGDDELARELVARMDDVVAHSLRTLQPPIFALPANTLVPPGAAADKSGYLVTQRNTLGHFRLGDDEALVAVASPGGAGYFAFTLTNPWGITPDSSQHQHSLNHLQAEAGPDGRLTIVVSHRDPGIRNWIDPSGLREGILMLRWQRLDAHPSPAGGPHVTTTLVHFDALASALPPGTTPVDAPARRRLLEARRAGYWQRFDRR